MAQAVVRHKGRADYGRSVIKKLSEDLGTNETVLYYSLEFARPYPISSGWRKLTGSHCKALIGGENGEIFLNQLLLNEGLAQFDPSVVR